MSLSCLMALAARTLLLCCAFFKAASEAVVVLLSFELGALATLGCICTAERAACRSSVTVAGVAATATPWALLGLLV